MILELKDVYKEYTRGKMAVPVLKDISMQVEDGSYIAIMGPSGSGKTTLMNLIGCLDVPTSGQVLIDGVDISTQNDDQMAKLRNTFIGFVFQHFHLLQEMDALENVALPLLYAGVSVKERRARAEEALKKVGLEDRLHFKPSQLSGGQCQRVAIARAMVTGPRLLLADEPTGALDTASGEQVMEIFSQLNEQGMTIVMITHEPSIAASAKQIYHIRDGEIQTGGQKPSGRQNPSDGQNPSGGQKSSDGQPDEEREEVE
jgi:putative ABC transport system ATP-binding protein